MEKFKELVKGGTQSVIHGATAGTEPYIAGVLNETLNLPKKVYEAKSINDIYNLYKDTGKDLTRTKNDYKQAYEKFARQNLGISLAGETIGGLITSIGTIKTGIKIIDLYRLGRETELLGKAYDEVKKYPYKGTKVGKDDVMVEIRPIGDKNKYIINRGAAIEKDDNLIVQDIKPNTDLFDNTGTSGNFGMTKMIHKHGLTKQEVKKIPKLLREYKTTGIRPENNTYQWRVPLDSKDDFIFSFAPKEKHVLKRNILKEITIHKKGVGKNKDIPLSQKK